MTFTVHHTPYGADEYTWTWDCADGRRIIMDDRTAQQVTLNNILDQARLLAVKEKLVKIGVTGSERDREVRAQMFGKDYYGLGNVKPDYAVLGEFQTWQFNQEHTLHNNYRKVYAAGKTIIDNALADVKLLQAVRTLKDSKKEDDGYDALKAVATAKIMEYATEVVDTYREHKAVSDAKREIISAQKNMELKAVEASDKAIREAKLEQALANFGYTFTGVPELPEPVEEPAPSPRKNEWRERLKNVFNQRTS